MIGRCETRRWRTSAALLAATTLATLLMVSCAKCTLIPKALLVDPSLTGNSDADGLLEPFETVDVEPTWDKYVTYSCVRTGKFTSQCGGHHVAGEVDCNKITTETGTGILNGPASGEYVLQDSPALYHWGLGLESGAYAAFVSAPSGRPAPHWDAEFRETIAGGQTVSKTWTLHVGDSFWDVPRSNPFYKKIETLLHHGITAGCAPGAFCPDGILARSEIAVFLARGLAKGGGNIPDSGQVGSLSYSCRAGGVSLFRDVAPTDAFCKHVHYLTSQKVTSGCSTLFDCPSKLVTRSEMAQDVARAIVAPGGDSAVPESYTDKASGRSYSCDAASPNLYFTDVAATSPDCRHVHYLWATGVITGCGPEEFCGRGDLTRGEMAKFLVNAFGLTLYGP